MKKRITLLLLFMCCVCICCVISGSISFADNEITPSVFFMKDGASVNKDELAIRFTTYIAKDVYDYYNDNAVISVGTIFIYQQNYDGNIEDIDVYTNGVDLYYTTPQSDAEREGFYKYVSVYANIDSTTASQVIAAKSFVCVDGEYYYVENVQLYSYDYIASVALQHGEKSQLFKDSLDNVIQEITVDKTELSLQQGQQYQIVADTVPGGYALTYKSTNSQVATVNEQGVVTVVGQGNTTIIVSCGNTSKTIKLNCEKPEHKVVFKQDNSADIVKTVEDGGTLTDIPVISQQKEGYVAKWSVDDWSNITQDIVVTVVYSKIKLTVTFVQQGIDDIIKEVYYGDNLTDVPAITQQKEEGYVYGWSVDNFENITSNLTVTVTKTRSTCTVTFVQEGVDNIVKVVEYGGSLTNIPTVTQQKQEGYDYSWSVDNFENITSNLTVTVVKTPVIFAVTFKQTGLQNIVKNVEYGKALTDIPVVSLSAPIGYEYCWDVDDLSCIKSNVTVNAVLKAKQYTITYQTSLGAVSSKTQSIVFGQETNLLIPSGVSGFSFVGWQYGDTLFPNQVWNIDSNVTLTAVWQEESESFEDGTLLGYTASNSNLQIGVESCSYTNYGNKALALRLSTTSSAGYLLADKAIFQKYFSNSDVDAVAMDIYCTKDVLNNLYFCYNGTGNYVKGDVSYYFEEVDCNVGLQANRWYTVTYSRKYFNAVTSTGTTFRLLCFKSSDAVVYIDNIRTVGSISTVNHGDVYVSDELSAQQYFETGTNVAKVTNNGQNVPFTVVENGINIDKSVLVGLSDKSLLIKCQNKDEIVIKYNVKQLTKQSDNISTTYGSQSYYTINKQGVNYVLCDGNFVPCERSDNSALISHASLVELLPTVNGAKQSGTLKLVVLTDSQCYLYVLNVTLGGDTTEKVCAIYSGDNFDHISYSSLINGTEQNSANNHSVYYYDLEHMQRYKDSGLNIIQVGSTCAIRMDATTLREEMKVILTNAEKVGLKVIIDDNFFKVHSESTTSLVGSGCTFSTEAELDKQTLQHLKLYWDYPAFYGLKLDDEPSFSQFVAYGQITNSVQRVSKLYGKQVFLNCNLLPCFATTIDLCGQDGADLDVAYTTYLTKFIEYTGLDYLEYDLYPLLNNNSVYGLYNIRQWTLRNLHLASKVAKDLGVDLHVVTQTCTIQNDKDQYYKNNTRIMSQDDIAWLNNMIIGFGAKQIDYFTYYQRYSTDNEKFMSGGCFIDMDDTTTPLYYDMQKALKQYDLLAPVVKSFNYKQFNFIKANKAPATALDGAENFDTDTFVGPLTKLVVNKESTLLTTLVDDNNNHMYMVQNITDPLNKTMQTVTLTFSGKTYVEIFQDGARRVVKLNSNQLVLSLSQGNAVYIIAH